MQRDASTIGVILPVVETDLELFDERECGYSRILIGLDHVEMVSFLGENFYTDDKDHGIFWNAKKHNHHDSLRI